MSSQPFTTKTFKFPSSLEIAECNSPLPIGHHIYRISNGAILKSGRHTVHISTNLKKIIEIQKRSVQTGTQCLNQI
jgi:hypothetical protein